MTDLVFYTNPMSRGRVVRWMLEEVGQPYETVVVEYGAMKAPEYLAVNPMGKVPALKHGDEVVTETVAICTYLADAFPAAGLAPEGRLRAPYLRWLFFCAGPMEAAIVDNNLGVTVSPEKQRMVGYGSFEGMLDVLEKELDGRTYLVGDRFSTADLVITAQLGFGMRFGSIPKRPAFERYAKGFRDRPAVARANELDGPMPPRS